jgi:hypothetical protein
VSSAAAAAASSPLLSAQQFWYVLCVCVCVCVCVDFGSLWGSINYERNQRYVTLLVAWLQYVFDESSGYCLTWLTSLRLVFSSLNWGGLVFHFCVCACFCLIFFFFLVAAILFHCGRVKGFVI